MPEGTHGVGIENVASATQRWEDTDGEGVFRDQVCDERELSFTIQIICVCSSVNVLKQSRIMLLSGLC